MTVVYIIGGAFSAVMWLGLLKVLLLEPILFYRHDRKRRAAEPRVPARATRPSRVRWGAGGYRTPGFPTRA